MTRCNECVTDLETVQVREVIEYPVYRGWLEHDMQRMVLRYLIGGWRLACLEDRILILAKHVRNVLIFINIIIDTD